MPDVLPRKSPRWDTHRTPMQSGSPLYDADSDSSDALVVQQPADAGAVDVKTLSWAAKTSCCDVKTVEGHSKTKTAD